MENTMDEEIVLPEEPEELKQQEEVTEPVEQEAQDVAEPSEEVTQEQAEGKGANQRIKELVQEKKAAQEEVKSLNQRLAEITQSPMQPDAKQYVPQVQPGQELTMEQYQSDIAKASDAKIEIRLAQERAVNRINNESLDIVRKYPQLDPTSDQFDRDLSDAVVEATEYAVRVNPYTASVVNVVDKMMKPYQKAATREVSRATQTVAKQVSDAAMRPTSVRQPEKPASEKSIQELERELGITQA